MQVILLERVEKLGGIGDEVEVKNGFGRNFLIPQGKALRANKANRERFERERDAIEARNAENREAAKKSGEGLDGETFIMIRQAGETGQLYGSVAARDIAEMATEAGHKVGRSQVRLNQAIKSIGLYDIAIKLHAEVDVTIHVNVARSEEEAERQASGEDVIAATAEEQQSLAAEQAAEMREAAAELSDQIGGAGDED